MKEKGKSRRIEKVQKVRAVQIYAVYGTIRGTIRIVLIKDGGDE
jgi:hypothetical protein